eukprot:CAMPEP_0174287268 /NCGR_PEP_ID=MMETSP0809-20121228/15127_1 /TAXON_ID=73025 ORGANISM="Eutreptiella gymnastica-like, Strain CCMP1594" /NCGR_SAMPLE_ID=MMETSP0809 /ASSEMBLY_ACC=CAM_ASM_000658 /LENGTH=30 /DNA_ID= /DNA_START= /DNA_END= /DNA_ORIENTATION=
MNRPDTPTPSPLLHPWPTSAPAPGDEGGSD